MYKTTKTEHDFTAQYLGERVHEGTGLVQRKRTGERRGRKSKQGRYVRKFKITLLPTPEQVACLEADLLFFNNIYTYTKERLGEPFHKDASGMSHGYDVGKRKSGAVFRLVDSFVPHTPKYLMNSQNDLIKSHDWMRACTYQVSYRATVNAFADFVNPLIKKGRKSIFDGNTFEAKICYRLINGLLYLKKFNQMVKIKETLPKGSLESIRITKNADSWTAVVEILYPYDKAEDIREGKNGILETSTREHKIFPDHRTESILISKMHLFSDAASEVVNGYYRDRSLNDKILLYQAKVGKEENNLDLFNMACVAANARAKRNRRSRKKKEAKELIRLPKNYFSLSEGFYIDKNILHLTRWGISINMKSSPKLCKKSLEYIIIKRDQQGNWSLSGKRQRRYLVRNLSRIVKEFSIGINSLF